MKSIKNKGKSRRGFVKKSVLGTVGLALSARSYGNILHANDKINFAVVGLNGRGNALIRSVLANENTNIVYLCDVDSRALEKATALVTELTGSSPKREKDYRKLLKHKEIDAIAIATPDHWHAPMAIMAMKAGKHVFLEKPAAHNPGESERLISAQKATGKIIQIGTQQRSAPTSIQGIKEIKEGIIGTAYFAKTWYSNTRGTIGKGMTTAVPEWLDWDLWQGPAPRKSYKDNVVHYNWHWFKHWGTGEIHNNATHEIDIARLALGVDIPEKVSFNGGRFQFKDDWEFSDTQLLTFEFGAGKMLTWEGKSCNGLKYQNRGRGVTIHGTEGSVLLDRNAYILYDLAGMEIKRIDEQGLSATTDTVGAGALDILHMKNFLNAIRKGERLKAPVGDACYTNMLCHYGNIAERIGSSLNVDPSNGKIANSYLASNFWSREYEPGWEF